MGGTCQSLLVPHLCYFVVEWLPRAHEIVNVHLQVYTFLQDVQAKLNPAYIVKTDDDLYIRWVACRTPDLHSVLQFLTVGSQHTTLQI